ncbi:MAG: hypothetical protein L3J78_04215, partial [Thermoplasmata archaeon]|nr:hypothetical protein [Thermoplasmata archaeon]
AKTGWVPLELDGRQLLLDADDERKARRVLAEVGPEALAPVLALHVTAGSQPGIAASVSVEPGHATRGIAAIRDLAARLAA